MNYLTEMKKFLIKVVDIKLFFMDWFCYNLIVLIKYCKIANKNLDKALLLSRNQALCLKIWKLWRAPTTLQFNIFLLKLRTRFLLTNVYKRVCGIFFILFRSWVINKSVKSECVETRSFLVVASNSRSK